MVSATELNTSMFTYKRLANRLPPHFKLYVFIYCSKIIGRARACLGVQIHFQHGALLYRK